MDQAFIDFANGLVQELEADPTPENLAARDRVLLDIETARDAKPVEPEVNPDPLAICKSVCNTNYTNCVRTGGLNCYSTWQSCCATANPNC
jgi:hypothetical protein